MDDRPRAAAVLDAVRVSGASISTMGGILAAETVSSTDQHIARVDELQFDLGEGPCWDALAFGHPVLQSDLQNASPAAWPALVSALRDEPIRSLFAFPMRVGPLVIGAIDLYDVRARELDQDDVALVVRFAEQTGKRVLRRALRLSLLPDDEPMPPHARRIIHQATGFVIAQLSVPADEAELLIRASAFAEGRSMQEIAEEIISSRRRFSTDGTTIENEP